MRFLDVAYVVAFAEILVDERVDIAKLQFDRRTYVIKADDLGIVTDDLQPALQVSQMVVSHFQDK